jgi:hypothetical protein
VRLYKRRELSAPDRALAVERHENWLDAHRYLNIDDLREHKGGPAHRGMSQPDLTTTAIVSRPEHSGYD